MSGCIRLGRALLASGIGLFAVSAHTPAASADAGVERFSGTFRYTGSMAHERALIAAAIDRSVETMGPVKRRIARRRLLENNPPIATVTISSGRGQIRVAHDRRIYSSPLDGRSAPGIAPDGTRLTVSHRYQNGQIVELFRREEAVIRIVVSLSDDGRRLTCAVTISHQQLDRPCTYRLEFHRVT